MVPVIEILARDIEGLRLPPLAWSLSFGACLGGMGTLIGATANVVMSGIAEKNGHPISFLEFSRYGFPMMLISITITTIYSE